MSLDVLRRECDAIEEQLGCAREASTGYWVWSSFYFRASIALLFAMAAHVGDPIRRIKML